MAAEQRLARFLGWFSVGLGVAELGATQHLGRLIGIRNDQNDPTMKLIGVRELSAGLGILTQSRPTLWVWSRVLGDAMDIALLGRALNSRRSDRNRLIGAIAAVAGVTALDLGCSIALTRGARSGATKSDKIGVKRAVTINRSREELYGFWHNFENLPRFMRHLESVQVEGDGRSHWKTKAPAGKSVEWDAQIVNDRPNELISWRSIGEADVENAGSVRFKPAPGDRGTVVEVEMEYNPPLGRAGAAVAAMLGESPAVQVEDDLRALKQVMETGEVVLSDGTLYTTHLIQRPAQPPAGEAGAEAGA